MQGDKIVSEIACNSSEKLEMGPDKLALDQCPSEISVTQTTVCIVHSMLNRASISFRLNYRRTRSLTSTLSIAPSYSTSIKMASAPTPPPRMSELIRPPKFDRVPDKLDKAAFTSYHPIIAVRVDVGKMATIRSNKNLRPWMLDMPRTRVVMDDPEGSSTKLIRLKVKSPGEWHH